LLRDVERRVKTRGERGGGKGEGRRKGILSKRGRRRPKR
jgi:hypothetical protein